MFAFGTDCRFYIFKTKYGGSLADDRENVQFGDFFDNSAIEVDLGLASNGAGRTAPILCRDFCITLRDRERGGDSHVVLATSLPAQVSQVNDKPSTSFIVRKDSIESVANCSSFKLPFLDHISFLLVSLKTFKVVDYVTFKYDYIYLAHHLGISLHENDNETILSILSLKNQIISQLVIEGDTMTPSCRIPLCIKSISPDQGLSSLLVNDQLETDDAIEDESYNSEIFPGGLVNALHAFLPKSYNHKISQSLHIWKHQLLSPSMILLRLAPRSVILSTAPRNQSSVHVIDPLPSTNQISFLVLYDWKAERVECCFNSADPRLLEWIQSNWQLLRGPAHDPESFETAHELLKRHFGKLSEPAGDFSIIRRISNSIPLSPQQFVYSPWLDCSIVRWDPRLTTVLSRQTPLNCTFFSNSDIVNNSLGLMSVNYGQERVVFFSRARTGEPSFVLNFTPTDADEYEASLHLEKHRWCNLILHPTLPLILVYQYSLFRSTSMRVFFR